jgi:hypothetical protein
VKLVYKAFLNPGVQKKFQQNGSILIHLPLVRIPWDIEKYYNKCVKGRQIRDQAEFPDVSLGRRSSPLTVVDSKGRIILWYLPGLLSGPHRVSLAAFNKYPEPKPSKVLFETGSSCHCSVAQKIC